LTWRLQAQSCCTGPACLEQGAGMAPLAGFPPHPRWARGPLSVHQYGVPTPAGSRRDPWLPVATDDERSTPTQSLALFGRSAGPRASDTTGPVDEIARQLQHGTRPPWDGPEPPHVPSRPLAMGDTVPPCVRAITDGTRTSISAFRTTSQGVRSYHACMRS
jgi:hypothetical protein